MINDPKSNSAQTGKVKTPRSISWEFGRAAFKLIVQHKSSADPKSYSVWYAYASQSKPGLNKDIDEILAENGGITAAEVQQLHETHLRIDGLAEENLENISRAIEDKVAGAQTLMTEAITTTDEYVSSLDRAKEQLPPGSTREQIVGAIEGIMEQGEASKRSALGVQSALQNTQSEISQLSSRVGKVRETLMRDSVTELMNRQKFISVLDEKSSEALTNGYSLTVLILSVKNVQALNESAGMDISEFIVKSVSEIMTKAVGDKGICARFSGTMFAIVLPRSAYAEASKIARAIIDELDIFKLMKRPSGTIVGYITCGIGGSSLRAGAAPTDLIKLATEQAQQAKHSDKSGIKFDLKNQQAA
ncbi:MAG: GGDEF domain-containing protein [Pseudomonadota bacterium]